jgi:Flp pilus assembly protein TadD
VREGVEFAERTLELNPNPPNAYHLPGMMHAYADDYAAAETQMIRAQELLPNSPLLTIWRAFVAMGQGDDSDAPLLYTFSRLS